jgi:hypothetical protein
MARVILCLIAGGLLTALWLAMKFIKINAELITDLRFDIITASYIIVYLIIMFLAFNRKDI